MRLVPKLLLLCAVAAHATSQQLVQAQNDNLSYGNYAVGWPSSVIAFRFTNTAAATLDAAQVFTGNQSGASHTLEIRTLHPTTGLPDLLVGQPGTFNVIHARCWQGARFAQPAMLAAATDYFLVWRVAGMFPQHSVCADTLSGAVLSEVRYSDGSSWHAQNTTSAKFRLFAPYAAGSTATFGNAKPGIYGNPTIGLSGWPAIGSPIDVWLDNAARVASSAPPNAALLIGWPIPGGLPFPFANVFVTGEVLLLMNTRLHSSPTAGAVSHTLQVPNTPLAIGLPVSFQWFVLDPAAADGIAHSAAVTANLQ
ncbi:MAG: hypothetical protein IPK26_06480 [Planctomycetes bacterium]|nr:hypothetical protein [Planctomycetota bacterium]